MRFSQRIGKRPVKTEFEREGMNDELRHSLWSIVYEAVIKGNQ